MHKRLLQSSLLVLAAVVACKAGGAGFSSSPANDESYAKLAENAFCDARSTPLSTFGLDVDTASYDNVRSLLKLGQWPHADAVRVEEFVNAMRYQIPGPQGDDVLATTTEVQPCPWKEGHLLLRIGVRARDVDRAAPQPVNLVFLVDVSGSMAGQDRLPLVQRALGVLVDNLQPADKIAVVTYASGVNVPLRDGRGDQPERIRAAVDALAASGSTNGEGGLRTAYSIAKELRGEGATSRVIMISDGDFNVGMRSPDELRQLVGKERGDGTFLTVLGCGRGNLKDDNLEAIANHGDGNYHYLDSMNTAKRLFASRLQAELICVAKDAKVQVEFNPANVDRWRLLGYEQRLLQGRDFADERKDGGEVGAGQSVTALYEIAPRAGSIYQGVALRYRPDGQPQAEEHAEELLRVQLCWQPPTGGGQVVRERVVKIAEIGAGVPSHDFEVASTAAGLALLLRESPHRGDLDWQGLQRMADRLDGDDVGEYGLAEMVECAARLDRSRGR